MITEVTALIVSILLALLLGILFGYLLRVKQHEESLTKSKEDRKKLLTMAKKKLKNTKNKLH